MNDSPIVSAAGVTLIGAGPVPDGALAAALALAPVAIAADGGANVALPAGVALRAVIGDMDSVADPEGLRARGVTLREIAEQDSTDLEKCLRSVKAPFFVGVGFLGGRADHALAALNALATRPEAKAVLLGAEDVCFLCPDGLRLDLAAGTRVSFFPMGRARGVESSGLRWPVAGLDFAPDGRIAVSNAALGGPLTARFDRRRVIAILPAAQLAAAIAALG